MHTLHGQVLLHGETRTHECKYPVAMRWVSLVTETWILTEDDFFFLFFSLRSKLTLTKEEGTMSARISFHGSARVFLDEDGWPILDPISRLLYIRDCKFHLDTDVPGSAALGHVTWLLFLFSHHIELRELYGIGAKVPRRTDACRMSRSRMTV